MIFFFKSSDKRDELIHPVTICADNEKQAFSMCLINFTRHKLKGSPIRI